ncbi:MAG: hypothetical protein IJP95_08850 [Bacteroidales bacterium]|nr:hypothetical protein [Bacteroidales bacterium]
MKKVLLSALFAATLLAGAANAQITRGNIGNGTFIDYSGASVPNVYGIDFNNDGTLEFRITDGSISKDYIVYSWTDGGNNVCNSSMGWDYAAALTQGTAIGASSSWEGQGDCMINETYPSQYFIGFRFRLNDGIHYGWAMVNVSSSAITWVKAFYQATPGQSINAGDEGSAAIATAQTSAEIRSLGNNAIRIVGHQGEQFCIFDMAGKQVASTLGDNTVALPAKGVYVVRDSSSNSRKVIVY